MISGVRDLDHIHRLASSPFLEERTKSAGCTEEKASVEASLAFPGARFPVLTESLSHSPCVVQVQRH